ncbi:IclR family transcriptional regulator [Hydrogenophaga sp. BPS33]|uniref:IclR family transcriptional regulator n=1 Tax=Hydrogenophaga sp. BPS33 TaxID=2651974 RepID=UPI00131F7815|nr:IclR family transcriptional regulator [Hydrogenophaga sp. BPS33]QHE87373.1 IclR family transcriptional regulator [Hydrogenophaga sp. BPS33]
MRNVDPLSGTRSAGKAMALLRHVGAHHPQGIRLTELMACSGQDRSTAHRLLACLEEYGLVERAAPSKAYRLGMASLEMGWVSAGMSPVVERFQPLMRRLARQTGDTVFLMVRTGDHALCLHREEGGPVVKALAVQVGQQVLLGRSLAGLAMLAQLEEAELAASHQRQLTAYERVAMPFGVLHKAWRQARSAGFADRQDHRQTLLRGVGGAVHLSANSLVGMSIVALDARMPPERRHELGTLLAHELGPHAWPGERKE